MPDIDPAALTRSDSIATLNPLNIAKINGVAGPSAIKAPKPSNAAQRIDLEPLYTNLKAVIGDNWGRYIEAVGLFLTGYLNQNELSLRIDHFLCADPNTEHLHNQLIAAIYGNVLREIPDQGVAPWVSANDKPAPLSKPLAGDEAEQRLKREIMQLPARDRRRIKEVPDGQTMDPLDMSIARSLNEQHAARTIKPPETFPASAGGQVKTNWELEIRKRYLQPLSSETFEFPSTSDLHLRMQPICYEESLPNGCPVVCADFMSAALEHYMKSVISNIIGRVRSDLPAINSVGGGIISTAAHAANANANAAAGGNNKGAKGKREVPEALGVHDMRVAVSVGGWGELAQMPTVVLGLMNGWNEGVLEGWAYDQDGDERDVDDDEMQRAGKRPGRRPAVDGYTNGFDGYADDGGEDEEQSWGWGGGSGGELKVLGGLLGECLATGS